MQIQRTKGFSWCTDTSFTSLQTPLCSYVIKGKIGDGEFGHVYRCVMKRRDHSSREVALKVLNRHRLRKAREPSGVADGRVTYMNGLKKLEREVLIMQMLQKTRSRARRDDTER